MERRLQGRNRHGRKFTKRGKKTLGFHSYRTSSTKLPRLPNQRRASTTLQFVAIARGNHIIKSKTLNITARTHIPLFLKPVSPNIYPHLPSPTPGPLGFKLKAKLKNVRFPFLTAQRLEIYP